MTAFTDKKNLPWAHSWKKNILQLVHKQQFVVAVFVNKWIDTVIFNPA